MVPEIDGLSLQAQTAYAELIERLISHAADGRPASVVAKTIRGKTYYYLQQRGPLGAKQTYLGPASDALAARIADMERAWSHARASAEGREELVATLRAARVAVPTAAEAKILAAISDAGVFRAGAVLVGTHAFACLGNLLGVRWTGLSMRTGDIDLAQDSVVSLAITGEIAPSDLGSLVRDATTGVSLWPIPGFDRHAPSTSFRIHGSDLRVDIVTPLRGRPRGPIRLPMLGVSATPLRFLDYLLEETIPAAVVGGAGVLVNVPTAARFCLHKLIVARERPAHERAKAAKDLAQAGALIDVLREDRPADLRKAWRALVSRGGGWQKRAERSLREIAQTIP